MFYGRMILIYNEPYPSSIGCTQEEIYKSLKHYFGFTFFMLLCLLMPSTRCKDRHGKPVCHLAGMPYRLPWTRTVLAPVLVVEYVIAYPDLRLLVFGCS